MFRPRGISKSRKTRSFAKRKSFNRMAVAMVRNQPSFVQASRLVNQVQNLRTGGFMGRELKFVDSFRSAIAVATAPTGSEVDDTTMLCLNGIAQGSTQSTRIGTRVLLKSVQVNYSLTLDVASDQADALPSRAVRIFLVWDKQTNGAQFNGEDVYQDGGGNDVCSLRDLEFSSRFVVLREASHVLNYTSAFTDGTSTGSTAGNGVYGTFYRKLNIPVQYKTTGATVADIVDNSLHIMAFCDTAGARLAWQSRCRYTG